MCNSNKFYKCRLCGKIIGIINHTGVPTICCGEEMQELVPNTVDASNEKHLPVVTISGNIVKVEVGSVLHPMTPEHYIQWVYLQTEKGGQRKCLNPGEEPIATFSITDDKVIAAYEYCNLHGLWKTEV